MFSCCISKSILSTASAHTEKPVNKKAVGDHSLLSQHQARYWNTMVANNLLFLKQMPINVGYKLYIAIYIPCNVGNSYNSFIRHSIRTLRHTVLSNQMRVPTFYKFIQVSLQWQMHHICKATPEVDMQIYGQKDFSLQTSGKYCSNQKYKITLNNFMYLEQIYPPMGFMSSELRPPCFYSLHLKSDHCCKLLFMSHSIGL